MSKDKTGSAFPQTPLLSPHTGQFEWPVSYGEAGMTLRQYCAIKVAAGLLACGDLNLEQIGIGGDRMNKGFAENVLAITDALIEEMAK